MLKLNDRVMLTPRSAATFTSSRGGSRIVWADRRGVVKRVSKRGDIFVQWDGRASLDQWPGAALVKVECDDPDC